MTENFNMLIGKLVHGGYIDHDPVSIPVPVAVESDSEEAWQDFQDSQMSYNKMYAASVHAPL
jgi:hypothetical protein